MQVLVSHHAGFCWGVRRAMDLAMEASARWSHRGPIQTLGPLIHNPQALSHLALRGITQIEPSPSRSSGTVIIRAHGIPLPEFRSLRSPKNSEKINIVNATCPEVAKVQSYIQRHSADGRFTVVLGHREHAEVVAHQSFASAGCAVIATLEEAQALPDTFLRYSIVVAQTTFGLELFQEIVGHLRSRPGHLLIKNTICPDTWQRQNEAHSLVLRVDAVVVVGGRNSNNTRHLVEVAQQAAKPVQWVESIEDLNLESLVNFEWVGVLAGASTPTWIVDEVVDTLEQAGRPSIRRAVRQLSSIAQLPQTFVLALLGAWVYRCLSWAEVWRGALVTPMTLFSLCVLAPFLDPHGFHAKGQVRGAFLKRHRRPLIGAGLLGLTAAAIIEGIENPRSLLLWSLLVGLAMVLIRNYAKEGWPLRRIHGSKDLAQAMLPTMLILGPPIVTGQSAPLGRVYLAAFGVFAISLASHAWRHLHEFHEDRILGRETMPVGIGLQETRWLQYIALLLGTVALAWAAC